MLLFTILSIHLFQVAEFGGTLSLFLGFSFMTLWDGLRHLSTALNMWKTQGLSLQSCTNM